MASKKLSELFEPELVQKLEQNMDENGIFRAKKSFDENVIDQNLSKEERVNEAIKYFEQSLEHDTHTNRLYIIS